MDLYQIKHNNIYIYNIPKNIIKYIYFQNKQIHIKKEHPESLSEKLLYCKYYIEIDMNYYLNKLKCPVVGGELIGIKNKANRKTPLFLLVISDENNIGIYDTYDEIKQSYQIKALIDGFVPSREIHPYY